MANDAGRKSRPLRGVEGLLWQTAGRRQVDLEIQLIWKSLKTDRMTVAQLRLGDFLSEQRQKASAGKAVARGKMTFGDALQTYRERLNGDHSLKERSKTYREERIAALLKSWPGLSEMDVARIYWRSEFPGAFAGAIEVCPGRRYSDKKPA